MVTSILQHLVLLLLLHSSSHVTGTAPDEAGVTQLRARKLGDRPMVKIPHILWFNHENNFLITKEPRDLYDNVMKSVDKYRSFWDDPSTPVNFIYESMCVSVIKSTVPDLLDFYNSESDQNNRLNICRVAILYKFGGYALQVEAEVVRPFHAYSTTTFATVSSCDGNCLLPVFIASRPKHPILKETLAQMLAMYQDPNADRAMLTAYAMMRAFEVLPDDDKQQIQILEEMKLDDGPDPQLYPDLPRQEGFGNCNFVVRDPAEDKVNFFMGFLGSSRCLPLSDMPPGEEQQGGGSSSSSSSSTRIPQQMWFTYGSHLLSDKQPQWTWVSRS